MNPRPESIADLPSAQDEEFLRDWEVQSGFGAVVGTSGVDRQAASAPDAEQRKWFANLMESHGFEVHNDTIGNQFGLIQLHPGAPYVLSGSHLDSQPTAGRFDGAYGVLAAAHACFRLAREFQEEPSLARCNLAIVNWFNEEGSRFKPSLMGSSVFTGKLPLDHALAVTDPQGITVKEALEAIGERGVFGGLAVASYTEIHVQQGRSMEDSGVTIGLVNATWGARKFEIKVTGEQSHSGAALMGDRRDALLGAARIIVAARDIVDDFAPGMLHTSCGEINVYPNSPVVVASEARLLVDLRSPSTEILDQAHIKIMGVLDQVQCSAKVRVEVVAEHSWDQNPYPEAGVELARKVAERLELAHDRVMTVAGHDSTNMKDLVPTVMLFVPSVEGVSHNLNELTRDEDLLAGVNHLTGVIRELAQGALLESPDAVGRRLPE